VFAHSNYDAVELLRPVIEGLGAFDGRVTAEVLAGLPEPGAFDPATVRRLVDFGFLVPTDRLRRGFAAGFAGLIFAGYASIPLAVLAGVVH